MRQPITASWLIPMETVTATVKLHQDERETFLSPSGGGRRWLRTPGSAST